MTYTLTVRWCWRRNQEHKKHILIGLLEAGMNPRNTRCKTRRKRRSCQDRTGHRTPIRRDQRCYQGDKSSTTPHWGRSKCPLNTLSTIVGLKGSFCFLDETRNVFKASFAPFVLLVSCFCCKTKKATKLSPKKSLTRWG